VTASDFRGGSASCPVDITATPNRAPEITSCGASPGTLTEGQFGTVAASASDPDGDLVFFRWQQISPSSPLGAFVAPTASSSNWIAPFVDADTNFTLQVIATDSVGASDTCEAPIRVTDSGSLAVRWVVPAPAEVASGEEFPLALEVTGEIQFVSGEVRACRTDVPVDQCGIFNTGPFEVRPDSFFSGPPGRFEFTVRGTDCQGPQDYYFVAQIFIQGTDDFFFGPFLTPLTTTRLLRPTGPVLRIFPQQMTFNALVGLTPPAQTLNIQTVCGEQVPWTVETSPGAPWLSANPTSGATPGPPFFEPSNTNVGVDITGLNPANSPFEGEVTLSSPLAINEIVIPVRLNLLGGLGLSTTTTTTTPTTSTTATTLGGCGLLS